MADRSVDHLLIGGFAAGHCAKKLREEGATGSILLVAREADAPYERPPLSKEYLRGDAARDDALVVPAGWWEENDVELLTRTSAMKLDPEARTVKLSTREEVGFDKLLVATGANVRRLRVDGSDLDGIHYLRAFGNADAIREDIAESERVALIGGSYIGAEVAASLTELGKQCTILMQENTVLERSFGPEVGRYFQGLLEDHGVIVHGGDELGSFDGEDGRVNAVISAAGERIDCDCVVIGAGVMPDATLAKAAGLEIGESGGVLASSSLESSAPGIYVAGDMAEFDSVVHGRALRKEHWDVARGHGETVALAMLGRDPVHDDVPYFFSDLADWVSLEYVGDGSGEPVIRGSLSDGEFSVFYLDDEGRVTAALSVERSDDLEQARRMIREGASPSREALADKSSSLSDL